MSVWLSRFRDSELRTSNLEPRTHLPILLLLLMVFFPVSAGLADSSVKTIPQFRLKLLDGRTTSNKKLEGGVTVIDFWATWCKPCIQEIGDYNRFYREYRKKGIRFLAVAVDSGTPAEVRRAVKELKIEYPVASPSLKELDVFGDISIFPTTWIVDPQGGLQKVILGVPPNKHETLRATVDRLLKTTK